MTVGDQSWGKGGGGDDRKLNTNTCIKVYIYIYVHANIIKNQVKYESRIAAYPSTT